MKLVNVEPQCDNIPIAESSGNTTPDSVTRAKLRYVQDLIIAMLVGVLLAWVLFSVTSSSVDGQGFHTGWLGFFDIFNTFITSIIIYVVLSRRKERRQIAALAAEKARSESMRLVGASIAHELRTPLQSIKLLAKGTKQYLPALVESYELAKQHGLEPPIVSAQHLETLRKGMHSIDLQVNHSSLVIDMLLANLSFKVISQTEFQQVSISECIVQALATYPFSEEEINRIHWHKQDNMDFNFLGSSSLIIQVLFNLIKNALYFIRANNGKGEITIWLEPGEESNKLYVEDTAQGIPADILPHIFDKFFTKKTNHGTGIGLAFCKMCMQTHQGDIICESEYRKYTRFCLTFPKLEKREQFKEKSLKYC